MFRACPLHGPADKRGRLKGLRDATGEVGDASPVFCCGREEAAGVYSRPRSCHKRSLPLKRNTENPVKPEEIKKLDAYFKRTLNPNLIVKARPRKNDSGEVYMGDEFLGVVYRDDEDGEVSYNFSMAILDVDL